MDSRCRVHSAGGIGINHHLVESRIAIDVNISIIGLKRIPLEGGHTASLVPFLDLPYSLGSEGGFALAFLGIVEGDHPDIIIAAHLKSAQVY